MAKEINFKDDRVVRAIQAFESKTGGEMVVHVDERAHHYPHIKFVLAMVLGLTAAFTIGITSVFWMSPIVLDSFVTSLVIILFTAFGLITGHIISITRPSLLMSSNALDHYVIQRAETAFLENEVFATKQRIGILIHVSLIEKKVVLLADSGINERIHDLAWNGVVQALVTSIHSGKTEEGLETAISACTDILLENGFAGSVKDENELPDSVIKNN